MSYRILSFTVLCFVAWATATQAGQVVTLGSGTVVEIISIGPVSALKGGSALALKYQTRLPIGDGTTLAALRKETGELWDRFVDNVDAVKSDAATITAVAPGTGSVAANRSHTFAYKKSGGSWHEIETVGGADKLDPASVRVFLDRLDWFDHYGETKAFFLYVANDCAVTIIDQTKTPPKTNMLDRQKFLEITIATTNAMKHWSTSREILDLKVSNDGRSAEVTSHLTEKATLADREIFMTERSTDTVELRDHGMLLTKSMSVVEKMSQASND